MCKYGFMWRALHTNSSIYSGIVKIFVHSYRLTIGHETGASLCHVCHFSPLESISKVAPKGQSLTYYFIFIDRSSASLCTTFVVTKRLEWANISTNKWDVWKFDNYLYWQVWASGPALISSVKHEALKNPKLPALLITTTNDSCL